MAAVVQMRWQASRLAFAMSLAWMPLPAAAQETAVQTTMQCPLIDYSGLSDANTRIMKEARLAACEVLASQAFKDALAQEMLRESCDSDKVIGGQDLYAILTSVLPDHRIVAKKPWFAEAATNPVTKRIIIRRGRFEGWSMGSKRQGEMINTLVHEWTHLILGPDEYSRFQDQGHGTAGCPNQVLVSYRTGDLAEQTWGRRAVNPAYSSGGA